MIGRCNITHARRFLFEHGYSDEGEVFKPGLLEQSQKTRLQIDSVGKLRSVAMDENGDLMPVVNYFVKSVHQDSITWDSNEEISLLFLFTNYTDRKLDNTFAKSFEQFLSDKISSTRMNRPKDKIKIKAIRIDGEFSTLASIRDHVRDSNLRGVFIFDFNTNLEQEQLGDILETVLHQQEEYTLKDLIKDNLDVLGDDKTRRVLLGLFSQHIQSSIFEDEELLDNLLDDLDEKYENMATLILPASRDLVSSKFMFELSGLIEFMNAFFNVNEKYLSAVESAQHEIQKRVTGGATGGKDILVKTANASTIFLSGEMCKISSEITQQHSNRIEMRGVHITHFEEIDKYLRDLEREEIREYHSQQCNKIVEFISGYLFQSLHGMNILATSLNKDDDNEKSLLKVLFSMVMSLQSDTFVDPKTSKEVPRTRLKDKNKLEEKWDRFLDDSERRIIGKEVYKRLDPQTTELKYLRGIVGAYKDMLNNTASKGSLLILSALVDGFEPQMGAEYMEKLKHYMAEGQFSPTALTDIRVARYLLLEEKVSAAFIKIYSLCKEVTHSPALKKTIPGQPTEYMKLLWAKDQKPLNRNKFQDKLCIINEVLRGLKEHPLKYSEVGENTIEESLGWWD